MCMELDKLHVLVVEKDCLQRYNIRRELEKLNIDCSTYESSDEAMATFKMNNYDGVLLGTPYSDANGFIKAALDHKINVSTPIVLGNSQQTPLCKAVDIRHNIHKAVRDFVDVITTKPLIKRAV